MDILLAPHEDDESLFASFIIQRVKPLVVLVTDGVTHEKYGVTLYDRRKETLAAMSILETDVIFLGIRDIELEMQELVFRLRGLNPRHVFAPATLEGGNPQHNLVGETARHLWYGRTLYYDTYRIKDLRPQGDIEIVPTKKERALKELALNCYHSQLRLNRAHFDAVKGTSEYLYDYGGLWPATGL